MEDSQIAGVWTLFRTPAPHQRTGAHVSDIGTPSLGCSITGPDNTTVVAYINKQGGTRSHPVLRLVVDLFLWLQAQDITLRARHIPGWLNVVADRLSRLKQPITTEWSLHHKVERLIFRLWGTPVVDMFATIHNTHLPQFMSLVPEPQALAIDELSQDWRGTGRSMYIFPPFPLLNKVIQKLRTTQSGEVILIAPLWPSQPWFPHLLHLCVDHPRFLPYHQDLSCHNRIMSRAASRTICMHGGSHAALPSSRIFKRGI